MERTTYRIHGSIQSLVAALVIVLSYIAIVAGYGHDEVEHMHVAYRMLESALPYRDFPQNHLPAEWFLLQPFLKYWPSSLTAFSLARIFQILLLPVIFLIARGFIAVSSPKESLVRDVLLIWTLMAFALYTQWILIRPDVMMCFLVSVGLWLLGGRELTIIKALLAGAAFGGAAIFSIKMWSMCLVVALVLVHHARHNTFRLTLLLAASFVLAFAAMLMPLLFWLHSNQLWESFYLYVFTLNKTLSMSFYQRIRSFESPFVFLAIAGVLLECANFLKKNQFEQRQTIILGAGLFFGIINFHVGNQGDTYNYLLDTVPIVVCVVLLVMHLRHIASAPLQRLAITIAIPLMLAATEISLQLQTNFLRGTQVTRVELQNLINLSKVDDTCAGFSPAHPVFCHDAGPVMLDWDLLFFRALRGTSLEDHYRSILARNLTLVIKSKPGIIVIYGSSNPWLDLVKYKIVSNEELQGFWDLRPEYKEIKIGRFIVWVSRSRFKEFLESWQNIEPFEWEY